MDKSLGSRRPQRSSQQPSMSIDIHKNTESIRMGLVRRRKDVFYLNDVTLMQAHLWALRPNMMQSSKLKGGYQLHWFVQSICSVYLDSEM